MNGYMLMSGFGASYTCAIPMCIHKLSAYLALSVWTALDKIVLKQLLVDKDTIFAFKDLGFSERGGMLSCNFNTQLKVIWAVYQKEAHRS